MTHVDSANSSMWYLRMSPAMTWCISNGQAPPMTGSLGVSARVKHETWGVDKWKWWANKRPGCSLAPGAVRSVSIILYIYIYLLYTQIDILESSLICGSVDKIQVSFRRTDMPSGPRFPGMPWEVLGQNAPSARSPKPRSAMIDGLENPPWTIGKASDFHSVSLQVCSKSDSPWVPQFYEDPQPRQRTRFQMCTMWSWAAVLRRSQGRSCFFICFLGERSWIMDII